MPLTTCIYILVLILVAKGDILRVFEEIGKKCDGQRRKFYKGSEKQNASEFVNTSWNWDHWYVYTRTSELVIRMHCICVVVTSQYHVHYLLFICSFYLICTVLSFVEMTEFIFKKFLVQACF